MPKATAAIALSSVAGVAIAVGAAALAQTNWIVLPNAWVISQPSGLTTETDTFPQGAALSPDGKTLAVVESGYNPPTLRFYGAAKLDQVASVPLRGAFGRPLWIDGGHVLVAGANASALFVVDAAAQTVRTIALSKDAYPTAVAMGDSNEFAFADDAGATVRIGALDAIADAKPVTIGGNDGHVGGLAFSSDGKTLFASNRSSDDVTAVDVKTLSARKIRTGLHPSDLLIGDGKLYVAESDADAVGIYDPASGKRISSVYVGDRIGMQRFFSGASPNALASSGGDVYVSLGAANTIAVIRDGKVVGRIDAGWYPTDVVPAGKRLFIIDGKGEGTRPNPYYLHGSDNNYIAAIQYGSIRTYDLARGIAGNGSPQGAQGWGTASDAVVRDGGPIRHVFLILKENRSYDQILGDVPQGNGDPKIAWFGARVTPNEHAIAAQFGLFDNTYTSGEVSESGHNWTDGAFANDYVERTWPPNYGGRVVVDDSLTGVGAAVPRNGYIWQAAVAAHVSFRDYGECTDVPSLRGLYDEHYVAWNLDYSDLGRVAEWRREFGSFVAHADVPQLEWIWLPNDHTYGTRVGKLTPVAYVAQNDYALGKMIDTISHSPVWSSSAIFVIEDDSQDGPDHVSDQRTAFFLISPYARGGVIHEHYSTLSVLRTIELMLGIKPLSAYDAMAVPMYAAFSPRARLEPYDVLPPKVSLTARNAKNAYAAKVSATLDFRRPDANPPGVLLNIIAHDRTE